MAPSALSPDDLRIGGYFAMYEPRLPSAALACRARHLRVEAHVGATKEEAEARLRAALESLVDAFLLDRVGHARAFTDAHRVGRELATRFGCPLTPDPKNGTWHRPCGIWALHARLGSSWAGTTRGHCSLCTAPDLGCDHVPGEVYDGRHCHRVVDEVLEITDVSVVQFPDDPRCYRLQVHHTKSEIEAARGRPLRANEQPLCTHCVTCPAVEQGPAEDDVDQSLWPAPFEKSKEPRASRASRS